eukprot:gene5186-biopygen1114
MLLSPRIVHRRRWDPNSLRTDRGTTAARRSPFIHPAEILIPVSACPRAKWVRAPGRSGSVPQGKAGPCPRAKRVRAPGRSGSVSQGEAGPCPRAKRVRVPGRSGSVPQGEAGQAPEERATCHLPVVFTASWRMRGGWVNGTSCVHAAINFLLARSARLTTLASLTPSPRPPPHRRSTLLGSPYRRAGPQDLWGYSQKSDWNNAPKEGGG